MKKSGDFLSNFIELFRSRLGRRLGLPAILALMALFLTPAALGLWNIRVTDSTNAEIARHDSGLIEITKMDLALRKEQLAYQGIVFASHLGEPLNPQKVLDYQADEAEVRIWHDQAVSHSDQTDHHTDGTPHYELLALQEESWQLHQQTVDLFLSQLVPAVQGGAEKMAIARLDNELGARYDRMFQMNTRLSELLEDQKNAAARDQLVARERSANWTFAGTFVAVLLGLMVASYASSRVVKPLKELAAASLRMSAGDLGERVRIRGENEITDLGNAFNYMASSLEIRTSQLEKEQARIRSVHQSIADAIIVLDNGGMIVSVNPAAEAALGKTALELEGKNDAGIAGLRQILTAKPLDQDEMVKCWEIKSCRKKDCPSHSSSDRRCWLQCGTFCYNEIQGTFKQKRDACERCSVFQANAVKNRELRFDNKYYSVSIVPILDDEGLEEGRTLVLHDITDIHRSRDQAQQHSAEMEVLNSISEAVTSSLDLNATLDVALEKVVEVRYADAVFIHLLDEDHNELVPAASTGTFVSSLHNLRNIPQGTGCPGMALKTGVPIVAPDLRDFPGVQPEILEAGLRSSLAMPLKSKNEVIGILTLMAAEKEAFTHEDARLLGLIAGQIGVAVDNALLYGESVEHARKEKAHSRIASTLTASLDLGEVFDGFSELTRELVDFDRISIVAPEGDQWLRVVAVRGNDPKEVYGEGAVVAREGTSPAWVMDNQKPYITGDLESDQGFISHAHLIAAGFRSWMSIPLTLKNQAIGTLNFSSSRPDAFNSRNVDELKPVADQLALTLANQQLFEDISRAKTEWETTFDAVSEGIAIVDMNLVIVRLNRAAADMVGGRMEALAGRKCFEVIHKVCKAPENCPMVSACADDGPSRSEQQLPDGRTLELVVDPIFDGSGEKLGAVHFLRDVTEARRLRQQLVQSEKMVAVGELVSGVAHEINNPLTGVIGYAQLLLAHDLDNKVRGDVEHIFNEAERATKIVRHLLSFARKHQPERNLVDINEVIAESLELKAYDLKVNNVQVNTGLESALPKTLADYHQLQQVLLNLITNAQQAMLAAAGSGLITIETSSVEGSIRITVADNGPGIPADIKERVFNPFFTTKEVGKGAGLGLSVCYGVMEEHGGRIWVDESYRDGARLVVELPVISDSHAGLYAQLEEHRTKKRDEKIRKRISGNILLVDDEAAIRETLGQTLKRVGHNVDTAKDGHVALRMLKKKRYDCVVSDVKMPVIDGPTLHRAIVENDPDMTGAFIFISGDTVSPETRSYLIEAGAPYLAKPFSSEDLESVLQGVLAKRS